MSSHRLFAAEIRAYPGRVAGAAAACAVTAAGVGACLLLILAVNSPGYPADSPAAASAKDAENLLSLLLSLLLMGAVLVIGSTVSLWTGQRLEQFAVLRALGVTAERLRWLVGGDVARLALPAAALGAAVGTLPAAYLGRRLLIGRELFPSSAHLPSAALCLAVMGGVCVGSAAVAVLAALGSVFAAGRVTAIGLLRDAGLAMAPSRNPVRLVAGLVMAAMLCLPILVLLTFLSLPGVYKAALASGLALMIIPSLAVLAPWIMPTLTRPVCAALRILDRRVGPIAAAGLRAAPLRTAAIAVPVLLSVGTAVCLLGSGATMGAAIQRQTEQGLLADGVVAAKPGARLPITPGAIRGATATALVATELTPPATTLDDQPEAARTWGVEGGSLGQFLDLGVKHGQLADLREGTFAAGAAQTEQHHWRLGQPVALRLSDGRVQSLRLVAVYRRDLAFPEFLLPRSSALAHTAHPHAEQILLSGDIRGWPRLPGQELSSRAEYLDRLTPRSPQDNLAGHLVVAVVSGYALLAAANICALAQRDRRAQRAHLRALGLSRLQLARCALYEVLGAALVGVGLSAGTALVCLSPFALALGLGPLPILDVPWSLGVLAAAFAAVTVPTLLATHPMRGIDRQFATGAP